jgi:hypothetical protein
MVAVLPGNTKYLWKEVKLAKKGITSSIPNQMWNKIDEFVEIENLLYKYT